MYFIQHYNHYGRLTGKQPASLFNSVPIFDNRDGIKVTASDCGRKVFASPKCGGTMEEYTLWNAEHELQASMKQTTEGLHTYQERLKDEQCSFI
jgi:hypothetical protein